jgi:hypothetical protein
MKRRLFAALLAGSAAACGGYETTPGTLSVMNGPAAVPAPQPRQLRVRPPAVSDGPYALSPTTMTMTVTAIGFLAPGESHNDVRLETIEPCTATYDRSLGALAVLSDCGIPVRTGEIGGLVIGYDTTYAVVIDDQTAGIFSDPDAPGGLTTTRPPNGPRPINVRDQNAQEEMGQVASTFVTPLVIEPDSAPQVSVVFEPTHWIKATSMGGVFAPPWMGGNPPIIPAMSRFARAAYYTNLPSTMSYHWACDFHTCMSLLFLYSDEVTPVSVTWQDNSICGSGGSAVAFNGNGANFGTAGMLGLDSAGMLAWASPAATNDQVPSYTGVYAMPQGTALGQASVVSYRCGADVPPPVAGPTYASGAPTFVADGTLSLTLWAQ